MAHCPSCGSARLRNGYRTAPFPLRVVGIRTLLCDNCNYEFRAFSPIPPKSSRQRRHHKRKADVFNNAPEVDLQALVEAGSPLAPARRAPAPIPFDRAVLPSFAPPANVGSPEMATVAGRASEAQSPGTADVTKPTMPSNTAEDDFAPPPHPVGDANRMPASLRERITVAPPAVSAEEPLMRLKEDLEERRSYASLYTCPACGSHEVARRHRKLWERVISSFTSIRPYRCERCAHRFHARRQTPQPSMVKQREAEFLKESCFNQTDED